MSRPLLLQNGADAPVFLPGLLDPTAQPGPVVGYDYTSIASAPSISGADTVSLAGSGIVFNNTFGSGVTAAFKAAVTAAENFFQSHFTNAVTLSCSFDLQHFDILYAGYSGLNTYDPVVVSYAAFKAALGSHATTADDRAAVASLPTGDPSNGAGFAVPVGEARILDLAAAGPGVDDAIVLNSSLPWTYGQDAIGVLEHEISEGVMGRIGLLGVVPGADALWGPMDLFRYSSAGRRDDTGGADGLPSYFSVDGRTLTLEFHNSIGATGVFDGSDFADWKQTQGDAFGPGGPGGSGTISATDLRVMDVLGWTPIPPKATSLSYAITALDANKHDGTSGVTPYTFRITRSGDTSAADVLNYSVAGSGDHPAPANLFVNPSGVVRFATGDTTQVLTVNVAAALLTSSEGFTVTLSGPVGTTITPASASGILGGNHALPTLGGHDVAVTGSHDQYVVVDNPGGQALIRDIVAGRDGDHAVQGLQHVVFSDGTGVLDPTGDAETITRLYQAALNRAPDQAGLDLFTNAVSTNAITMSALAGGFTSSPEFISRYGTLGSAGFVAQLYQNVLHRAPDAAGAQNFIDLLNSGGSRPDALVSIANSAENRTNLRPIAGDKNDGEAARLYQAALNRAPDSAGLALFSTALSNGATAEQIAHGFVTSAEFASDYGALTTSDAFVGQLYVNVLHRTSDAAGRQNFINALNAGASREAVLLGFSDSTENRINTAAATHDTWVFLGS